MSTLQEIEKAIDGLPREQVFALGEWLQQRIEDQWDARFEEDATSGRLARAAERALKEHRAGKSTDFPGDAEQSG